MKRICILLLWLFSANAHAQMKLIKKLLSNEKDTTRRPSFMPVPSIGYAQETGLQFGVGAIYSYYMDRKDTLNRSSNFSINTTYSTKKTYDLTAKADVWAPGNVYHFTGDIRFKKLPFNFYGIGNATRNANEDKLVQNQIKLLFEGERQLYDHFYTGLSLAFENYRFTDRQPGGIFETSPQIKDRDGGSVGFIGISQSYDARNSNNYTTAGFYARATLQYAPAVFGGQNFKGTQFKLDIRNFTPVLPKVVLAWQGLFYRIGGKGIPFYLLQQMGNDQMMRGYYGGRYRDENLLATQAELRYRFINRFGVVAFVGAGRVFANDNFSLRDLKPNYGIGGRYFFDTAKGLSVRLDYGFGEKLPGEKRQGGMYISLAEAF